MAQADFQAFEQWRGERPRGVAIRELLNIAADRARIDAARQEALDSLKLVQAGRGVETLFEGLGEKP